MPDVAYVISYTVYCKILMGGNFDGYWLFKYLMENILMDGHCLSPYTCKCCIVCKQFDGLKFDGLAGKCQKHQNFPDKILRYTVAIFIISSVIMLY